MSKALSLVARLKEQVAKGDLGQSTQVSQTFLRPVLTERDEFHQVRYLWDRETQRLVQWVQGWTPPSQPFVLRSDDTGRPVVTVEDPYRFKQAILADVAAGPAGPRSRTGALQSDLTLLHQMFGGTS